jgi:hypothetical protein
MCSLATSSTSEWMHVMNRAAIPRDGDQTMLKRLNFARLAILAAAAIVVACGGEQALLVSPRLDGAPPLGMVSDTAGATVRPVSREITLTKNDSWSFDVGPAGTVVRHPSTGLTITVPAGAVAAPTHITVTALRGAAIAYRFEPHGLQFAVPLQLSQSLRGMKLPRSSSGTTPLFAGYFATDSLPTDPVTGEARVIEILPVLIDVGAHSAVLSVRHFSGYTVASASSDSLFEFR